MFGLYLVSLGIHIFSAMFWVGGMLFYLFVIIAVIRDPELKNVKLLLLKKTAIMFRSISYYLFGLFIISGIGILHVKGYFSQFLFMSFWVTGIGQILGIKLTLFLILLISSIYHDFITGPSTFEYLESNPPLYEKYRRISSFFGRANLLISAVIAILGILISRGVGLS